MTIADALKLVREIERAVANMDDEKAHGLEDDLRERVLESIAANLAEDPRELASVALSTSKLEFSRWCS